MADARFVPRSARSIIKIMGGVALVSALAGASAFVVWGCTNDESANFMEPNRPFPADSGSGGTTGTASDAGPSDAGAKKDATSHDDAAKADSAADH